MGEKGLIVYGPNGVGKSSIIDALEATIAGKSTLFSEGRSGVSWDTAAPHIRGGGPPSVTLSGKVGGKAVAISLGQTAPKEVEAWLTFAGSASFVLRRYMLLKFIDAQPKDRYAQVQPFLNLGEFVAFEDGLKDIVRILETGHGVASTELASYAQVLRQTFQLPSAAVLVWVDLVSAINQKLVALSIPEVGAGFGKLQDLLPALESEIGGSDSNLALARLGAAKVSAQQLVSVGALVPLVAQVEGAAGDLAAQIKAMSQEVSLDLLDKAREHVSGSPKAECPVCEQSVNREELLARLDERIASSQAVRAASDTLTARVGALRSAATKFRISHEAFVVSWNELGLGALPASFEASIALLRKLEALSLRPTGSDTAAISSEMASTASDLSQQITTINAAIKEVGGGERRTKLVEVASLVSALLNQWPKYEVSEKYIAELTAKKLVAARLAAHAESARKAAVQDVVDRVAALANSYYEEIHPGEGIASSRLEIRQTGSGSIQLSSTFHGRTAPPLLYYSEAHLDTLGLCYFLAIRKLEALSNPKFKLLLIDDVMHSVDADHRSRLANLLKGKFDDHQVVVVTHDKYFYDRLKAAFGGGYKYLAITDWDVDSGPKLGDALTDLDRVIDASSREGKSHDDLAAAGGRFFEWHLRSLAERLQVPIPARFTRDHDIGSIWPSVAKKLDGHKQFLAAHPTLTKDLNDNGWVRNKIGAHSNEEASAVTPKEVHAFLDSLAALYHATSCAECRSVIQRSQSGAWRCECPKLNYD